MKKLILLFLSVIVCMTMQGQTHMKFMGIPLDGTVESFSQKLKAKGINYDAVASKKLSPGAKLYRGTFMGEKAQFVVMFNAKNRIVYGVGVELSYSTMELAKTPFFNIADQLHKKYPAAKFTSVEKDDKTVTGVNFTLLDDNSELLGVIVQTLDKPDGLIKTKWGINLIYTDAKNYDKNSETNNEDL